jgi:hypothetical protein
MEATSWSVQISPLQPDTMHLDGGGGRSSGQQTAKRSAGSMTHPYPGGQRVPPRPQKNSASGGTPVGHWDGGGGGLRHPRGLMQRSGLRGRDEPAKTWPSGQPQPGPMAALHRGIGWSHEAGQPNWTHGRNCWLEGHCFLRSSVVTSCRRVPADRAGTRTDEISARIKAQQRMVFGDDPLFETMRVICGFDTGGAWANGGYQCSASGQRVRCPGVLGIYPVSTSSLFSTHIPISLTTPPYTYSISQEALGAHHLTFWTTMPCHAVRRKITPSIPIFWAWLRCQHHTPVSRNLGDSLVLIMRKSRSLCPRTFNHCYLPVLT